MSTHTIDTAVARQMVEAHAIRSASIIGQPGGWCVMLKLSMTEKPLGTQRTDTAARMKRAHEAAAYDVWFRAQVQEALDDPAPSVAHAEVMADVQALINQARKKKKNTHHAARSAT